MRYPLEERIGSPELLIGRKKEFEKLHQWLRRMPKKLSQSIALLARKKSGKTAIVQRLFNELWSAGDSIMQDPNAIPIIPIYMEIGDKGIWYPHFAMRYRESGGRSLGHSSSIQSRGATLRLVLLSSIGS